MTQSAAPFTLSQMTPTAAPITATVNQPKPSSYRGTDDRMLSIGTGIAAAFKPSTMANSVTIHMVQRNTRLLPPKPNTFKSARAIITGYRKQRMGIAILIIISSPKLESRKLSNAMRIPKACLESFLWFNV